METIITAVCHFIGEMQKPVNRGAIPVVDFQMNTGEHVGVEVRTDHLIDLKEVADRIREEAKLRGTHRNMEVGTYHWHVTIR